MLMKKKVPLEVGKCSSQMRAKVSDDELDSAAEPLILRGPFGGLQKRGKKWK